VPQFKLLLLLAIAHVAVDTVALVIQPLWPDLRSRLALDDAQFQIAFVLWNMANSLLQLPIGYWAERHSAKWLIWAGPALGVACVSAVGLIDSFVALCLLLSLAGVGIAAFHPEAAALAASCAPENRSRALSIFAIGGYLGQALGPFYAGKLTASYGLRAITWTLAWGWAAFAVIAFGLRRAPAPAVHADRPSLPLGRLLHGKKKSLALLVALGVLRVAPMAGVPLALAFAIKEAGGTNADIGFAQSLFMGAIGAGSIACAFFIHHENERLAFWSLPLAASALLLVCPTASPALLRLCIVGSGFTMGVALPVLVSLGQQLLPDGQRIASGLTMGATWGLASPVAAGAIELFDRLGQPAAAFYALAGILAASSALCFALHSPTTEPSSGAA
jgi:FSR family fosmidomycin resistance protein-like MFS transporter